MTPKPSSFKVYGSNYANYASVVVEKTYELNSKHIEMLCRFKEKGWVELRNYRYDDPAEELDSRICYELVEMEMLDSDQMSWHLTFNLTDIGKQVLSQVL